MNYKVRVNGKLIEYGALVEKSRFSDEEWSAIYAEKITQKFLKKENRILHLLTRLVL